MQMSLTIEIPELRRERLELRKVFELFQKTTTPPCITIKFNTSPVCHKKAWRLP